MGYPHRTQNSLPAAGQALPDGIGYPQGSDERFLSCNRYIRSSFPKLAWRKDIRGLADTQILWSFFPPRPTRGQAENRTAFRPQPLGPAERRLCLATGRFVAWIPNGNSEIGQEPTTPTERAQ